MQASRNPFLPSVCAVGFFVSSRSRVSDGACITLPHQSSPCTSCLVLAVPSAITAAVAALLLIASPISLIISSLLRLPRLLIAVLVRRRVRGAALLIVRALHRCLRVCSLRHDVTTHLSSLFEHVENASSRRAVRRCTRSDAWNVHTVLMSELLDTGETLLDVLRLVIPAGLDAFRREQVVEAVATVWTLGEPILDDGEHLALDFDVVIADGCQNY